MPLTLLCAIYGRCRFNGMPNGMPNWWSSTCPIIYTTWSFASRMKYYSLHALNTGQNHPWLQFFPKFRMDETVTSPILRCPKQHFRIICHTASGWAKSSIFGKCCVDSSLPPIEESPVDQLVGSQNRNSPWGNQTLSPIFRITGSLQVAKRRIDF